MRFLLLLALLAPIAVTQDKPVEPEFADIFFRLDQGKLVPLERASGVLKAHGSITGKGSAYYEIAGLKSPVRVPADSLEFVVKILADMDPAQGYSIRKLEPQKDKRRLPAMTIRSGLFSGNVAIQQASEVSGQWARYGEHSAKVSLPKLQPGEYAFQKTGGTVMFCFGVD